MFAEKFKLNRRRYAKFVRKVESGRVYAVSVRLKLVFYLMRRFSASYLKNRIICALSDKEYIHYAQKRRVFSVFLIVKKYLVC